MKCSVDIDKEPRYGADVDARLVETTLPVEETTCVVRILLQAVNDNFTREVVVSS